ncbi:hypothetical protein GUJ93_ZPchr0013g37266 [Zizania palustris]|uniref:Uncharacterized protein n=1 Tax=Zizania palustris TaxID=103762 RepID=A0A8J6BV83_ZIZPA|nr:hypothetical protein GUJ93_ZPchr0013g37266 [Zizania palustris]
MSDKVNPKIRTTDVQNKSVLLDKNTRSPDVEQTTVEKRKKLDSLRSKNIKSAGRKHVNVEKQVNNSIGDDFVDAVQQDGQNKSAILDKNRRSLDREQTTVEKVYYGKIG